MQFLIIVKATAESEAGDMPDPALINDMAVFHEELAKAGVLLDATGSSPRPRAGACAMTASGARWWTGRSPNPRNSSPATR